MRIAVAFLVVALSLPIYGQDKRPKTAPNQEHVQTVSEQQPPPTSIVVVHEEYPNGQGKRAKENPKSYLARLFSAENLPQIGLFVAGVVGIVVGIRTLRQIRTQTTLLGQYVEATKEGVIATRDSALAAKQTLQVLEAEQRARVGAAKIILRSFHPGENIKAMLVLRNFGKSTALHVKAEWYMEVEPAKNSWSVMGAAGPDVMLYPDIDFALPIETDGPISVETFEAVGSGRLFLYVWGQVSYRILDEQQSPCASLFSFVYDPELREFLACGGFWQTEDAF